MTSLSECLLHILRLPATLSTAGTYADIEEAASLLAGLNQLQYVSRVGLYILLILLYATVCIPLIFYFTRRNRTHLRLFLIVNALAFSAVIILIGNPTRHDKIFLSSICLEEYTETRLSYFSYNSVQAPYSGSFTLETNLSWQVLPMTRDEPTDYDTSRNAAQKTCGFTISRMDSVTRMIFTNQTPFQPNYFLLQKTQEISSVPVTSQLSFSDGIPSGTITNNLGYDLEDAVLLIQDCFIPIHTFENGSTLNLAQYDKYSFNQNTLSELIRTLISDKDVYQQQAIIQEQTTAIYLLLLNRLMTASPNQGLLLGRSPESWEVFTEHTDLDYYLTHFTGIHLNIQMIGE